MQNKSAIRTLFFANSISGIAQGISMIAIPWYILSTLGLRSFFGMGFAFVTFISLFWSVWAGTIIDKYDRKVIFQMLNFISGLIVLSCAILAYLMPDYVSYIAMFVFSYTILVYNIHYPCLYAFAQEICERTDYQRITSYIEIQGQMATFTAGALATILLVGGNVINILGLQITLPFSITAFPIWTIFGMDALTYIIAAVVIRSIRYIRIVERQRESGNIMQQLRSAWDYLSTKKLILYFGLSSAAVFLSVVIASNQIHPTYVKDILLQGADVYSSSEMYFALGAASAGIIIRQMTKYLHPMLIIVMLSVFGLLVYLGYIFIHIIWVYYFLSFTLGLFNAGIRIMRFTIFFNIIDNLYFGRVSSFINIIFIIIRVLMISLFALPFFNKSTLYSFTFLMGYIFISAIFTLLYAAPVKKMYHLSSNDSSYL